MKTILPVELLKVLSTQPDAALFDVRTPVEYAEVHVPQAISIPLDGLDPQSLVQAGKVRKDEPVYLLCRSGQRATKAAERFTKAGFTQPIVVEGGTLAWIEANLEVARSAVQVVSLERQVRIAAGAIVFAGGAAGAFCELQFHLAVSLRRRGPGVRRHHGFLRHGPAAGENAVEPQGLNAFQNKPA